MRSEAGLFSVHENAKRLNDCLQLILFRFAPISLTVL